MNAEVVFAGVTAVAVGVAACGDGALPVGVGGGITIGASSGPVGPSGSSSAPTGTGGSSPGDGNDSFDEAQPISGRVSATLSPTGDSDYYSFEGQRGELIWAHITDAQTTNDAAFDPTWIDTVITLYDKSKTQIAENNEPRPHRSDDAELFTVLPADGVYYLRVTECHTYATDPSHQCQDPADKDHVSYTLMLESPDPTQPGWVQDAEQGDDAASAEPIDYAPNSGGGYYLTGIWGGLRDAADVDVYSFSLPPDVKFANRSTGDFLLLANGAKGDGSTTPAGDVWIADATAPAQAYARVDGTIMNQLWPPLVVDHPYLLFVEHPSSAPGANDFYVVLHGVGDSNPVEQTDPGGNDQASTAEPLVEVDNDGIASFYFEGDIDPAPADVDYFRADVPAALPSQSTMRLVCNSERVGSGLRGFNASLLSGNGVPIGSTKTETAKEDFVLTDIAVPAGASQILVRVAATAQDPTVLSKFYRCGLHFMSP